MILIHYKLTKLGDVIAISKSETITDISHD